MGSGKWEVGSGKVGTWTRGELELELELELYVAWRRGVIRAGTQVRRYVGMYVDGDCWILEMHAWMCAYMRRCVHAYIHAYTHAYVCTVDRYLPTDAVRCVAVRYANERWCVFSFSHVRLIRGRGRGREDWGRYGIVAGLEAGQLV